ncbi:hypothetical protein [Vibrio parahaemolyticus]|uniref:hypothetical protein n=1 Tax=Vibrio parahaemolyticus TaxID=670 RepID=UPI000C9BDC9C|nr:hypothetical protein [Vibrio parahaemolyticus]PMS91984.1 hypothetical protein C1T06_23115 [Vibrio parahaemolyticus]
MTAIKINKNATLKLLNIADCIYALCVVITFIFAKDKAIQLLAGWALIFLYSGLGLRRFCNGKGMMKYGTIGNESDNDEEGIRSSYEAHRWTIGVGLIMSIGMTLHSIILFKPN